MSTGLTPVMNFFCVLVCCFIFLGCSKQNKISRESQIQNYSIDLISNNLVSPLTAKFSNVSLETNLEKNVLLVFGKVDSENSFGALIRTGFTCVLTNPEPEKMDWLMFSIGDAIPVENQKYYH
jgi:hypothetical protein